MNPVVLLALLLASGCGSYDLHEADRRYAAILAQVHAADRDVARNAHNRDARRRLKEAEQARVAFFQDPRLAAAIEEAREAPEGSREHTEGEAWHRQAVRARSWTPEEKAQETELLARLDALAAADATWSPRGGRLEVRLAGDWSVVSKPADGLPAEERADLARQYVEQQMAMAGDDLRELVRLRNHVARREGFETWWHLCLYQEGLQEEEVHALVEALRPTVQAVNQGWSERIAGAAEALALPVDFASDPMLRRHARLEAGRDEAEPYFDTDLAEGRVVSSLREMGVALDGWQVYTGPSRHTRRGAYSFPIRPPERIALVMSLDRRFDVWAYEALIHEAAHAFRWRSLRPEAAESPVLWDPPAAFTEGFAQLFERILLDPAWTSQYIPDMPEPVRQDLAAWRTRQMARWVAEAVVDTAVERRAYEDPTNLAAVARFCADLEQSWGLRSGPVPTTERGVPYCETLHTPLVWHYPGYVQNYLFSYVIEARLYDALVTGVGRPVGDARVGPWLAEHVLRDGALTDWKARLDAVAPGADPVEPLRRYMTIPTSG